jgi:transposase
MEKIGGVVAGKVRTVTAREVIVKAIDGQITWIQASEILGITARHMRRLRERYEKEGYHGLVDRRRGRPRRSRIPLKTIEEVCRLKRESYADFSVRHFYEHATEKHGLKLSYQWTLQVLQAAGIVRKEAGRGRYRRRRERRPMTGMLIHLDGSTHEWIRGLEMKDLIVGLDDADGRILFARFFHQEGTASTFAALEHILRTQGRFCELYTDRGSHFCRTAQAGADPDEEQNGQVARALKALGIRHILARSPEARGRGERAFGTIQGRLPQELRLHGITDYEAANRYLEETFTPHFNRHFTVSPLQRESAFVRLKSIDLELLLSSQHERIVRNDNTVTFNRLVLQLPSPAHRPHFVRCTVLVHEFPAGTIGVSFQGRLLARFSPTGELLRNSKLQKVA